MRELREYPTFKRFMEEIEDREKELLTVVKTEEDHTKVLKAQGELAAIEFIRDLPERMDMEDASEEQ